jgi:cob(I)alamin adenosyltransferase
MKIYTKKGDDGTTSLIGGTRVHKFHHRIDAYGTVDELNSFIGLLGCDPAAADYKDFLKQIQDNLFVIGSHLAMEPGKHMQLPSLRAEDLQALEDSIDTQDAALPPLKNFVLPGGHPANALAHVARCVCRRAERAAVEIDQTEPIGEGILQYLNRLSDWLFIFARTMSAKTGADEIAWAPRKSTE